MKWLSNIYDPNRIDAKNMLLVGSDETRNEAWASQQRWLKGKIIGDPKPTPSHSLEEMKRQHLVGVYDV